VSLVACLLASFAAFGAFVFLSQCLQLVFALAPLQAGIGTTPWALMFVVGSLATPIIAQRVRPAVVMAAGLVVAVAGFALFTQVEIGSGFGVLLVASVVVSLGLAPVVTLAMTW
jgi:MFS transporter, DHA2 family, multidrug resistance protein